jgi:hypothetical protein
MQVNKNQILLWPSPFKPANCLCGPRKVNEDGTEQWGKNKTKPQMSFSAFKSKTWDHLLQQMYTTVVYGSRCTQLPLIEKLLQWLSGPSPSLSVAADRPRDTGPDSNDVRTRSIYSTNSVDDINAKSGWSLKTEKIRLKWHVYIDTTHTIRHLFLTWTSLYPFAFLKT